MKRLAGLFVLATFIAACRESAETPAPVAPIDEAAITNVWHKAKLRGVAFRAIGQEPGWLLEITNGVEILLVTDYGETRTSLPYVEPVVFQEERRTRFVLEAFDTIIEIRGEPCRDVMSGEEFEVTVTIKQTQQELQGCGRALF
jgi:putative lipoprotein